VGAVRLGTEAAGSRVPVGDEIELKHLLWGHQLNQATGLAGAVLNSVRRARWTGLVSVRFFWRRAWKERRKGAVL
jgi:hypothetical protein